MTAELVPDMPIGGPEWLRVMTASKVAAVLGLSPWESRFSLWHRMAGLVEPQLDSDEKRRGHYLEPAIIRWWADQHRDHDVVLPGGTYRREWMVASPDGMVYQGDVRSVLEVKTAADGEPWGADGSEDIPVYYRAQVMWQMDVLGVKTAHVAVLLPYLEFRQYVIPFDADEAAYIRTEARAFLESLPGGPAEARPRIDEHAATYEVVRELHPDIDPEDVDLPDDLATAYITAVQRCKDAEAAKRHHTAVVADLMGNARRARWNGHTIATRQAKADSRPYVVAARRLPEIGEA